MQISVQRLYRSFELLRTGGLKNCRYRGLVSSFHTRNSRRWTPTCSSRNRGRCRGRHSSCWTLVRMGLPRQNGKISNSIAGDFMFWPTATSAGILSPITEIPTGAKGTFTAHATPSHQLYRIGVLEDNLVHDRITNEQMCRLLYTISPKGSME
jgi:hypothetical protein